MQHDVDDDDAAWADVRGRRELSGEAKLAWHFLWKRAKRRPGEVWFSYLELAIDQGRTERPPRDWVKHLRQKRFVELLEEGDGRSRVYVKQPQDVLRPVERQGFTDERQRRLPLDQPVRTTATGAPAEDRSVDPAQNPPVETAARALTLRAQALQPLLSTLNSSEESKVQITRSAAVDPAQQPPANAGEPRPIAAAIAGVLNSIDARPGDELERVEKLTLRILDRVGDANLQRGPVEHLARAIVEGQVPAKELEGLLTWIDQTCRANSSNKGWVLFVGGAERVCGRHGVAWPFGKRSRSPASTWR